jgi:multiple sugar transport system substrate-binding protein
MKMKKQLLGIVSFGLVAVLTLAGCGGGNQASAPTPAAPAAQGSTPSDPAPVSGEEIVLTYYSFSEWTASDPFRAVYEEAKTKFEAENPGYIIELQSDPWGDWEQKYKTMFAAGNPADIFIVNNPDFPMFANSGSLLEMNSYVEPGFFDKFFPGVQGMYRWQGSDMAMAFTTDCRMMWYNKDIFAEAGLDPNKPPTTWAELASFANTITQTTGKYGFGMDLGLKEFPTQAAFNASNGSIINVGNDGSITPNVDTPEFRGYLQLLLDMKPTFQPDYTILNHHDVASQFAEGQMGIIIGNTLTETDIYSKDFYGQALVPRMNASAPNGSFGGGFGIAVSSRTRAPEQAVKFAQILTDAQFNGRLISDIPASEAGLAQSDMSGDPDFAVYLDQIQYARQAQPKTLFYAEIDSAVHDIVVEVVVGGMDIDTAVSELSRRIIQIVNE